MPVSALLLAAGNSQRFKAVKQLAKLNRETVIEHSSKALLSHHFNQVYVALGAHIASIAKKIPEQANILYCSQWQQGIGKTIAQAITNISKHEQHIMIALADQVLVPAQHIDKLLTLCQAHPDKIIATKANGVIVPPVIFPKTYHHELAKLTRDKGAISIIKVNEKNVIYSQCPEAIYDIDTQEDLVEIKARIKQNTREHA